MVRLLLEYADKNNIFLEIYEKDIENRIINNYYHPINSISEIDIEIIKLLYESKKKNKIDIIFNEYSEFIRRLKKEKIIENINEEVSELKNSNHNLHLFSSPTLVIVINDFIAYEYDQLDITKDEFLIVTDWIYEEGWVYGYRKNNKEEKGKFPKIFIKICNENAKVVPISNRKITPEYKILFEEKVRRLRLKREMKIFNGNTSIFVNRKSIFNDAFNCVMNKSPVDLKRRLKITYQNEEGIDAGGLLRDFFYQIAKEIGNPNYSLFKYSNDSSYELEINTMSGIANPNHLKYFKFIGRIIGLAIFNKQYLPLSLTLLLYKKLLNQPIEFSDLKYTDPEMFRNIEWLKNNKGAEKLCLIFEISEEDCFGNHKNIQLKPNGANIAVTDDNKDEFI
eukprot:jgi/Orpsp1_1/1182648/evm.model.c7180000082111.1